MWKFNFSPSSLAAFFLHEISNDYNFRLSLATTKIDLGQKQINDFCFCFFTTKETERAFFCVFSYIKYTQKVQRTSHHTWVARRMVNVNFESQCLCVDIASLVQGTLHSRSMADGWQSLVQWCLCLFRVYLIAIW
jgi:hypothetical protein